MCLKGCVIQIVLIIVAVVVCYGRYTASKNYYVDVVGVSESVSYKPWDYLMFTQRWPQTACLDFKEHHPNATCNIYKNVTSWIIHGIWPNKIGTFGPFYCNRSWEFDPTRLSPIKAELLEHWPNIYGHSSVYSLWQHEWTKHGTCAAELAQLNTELRYFQIGLDFLNKYSVMGFLNSANVKASKDKAYDVEYIEGVLLQHLLVKPLVVCDYDKVTRRHYLNEVRICFNKMFHLRNCEEIPRSCPKGNATYYTPIQHRS